jgi:hypothetical protein
MRQVQSLEREFRSIMPSLPLIQFVAAGISLLSDLPPPVAAYAERFNEACLALGGGGAVANDMYVEKLFDIKDVNLDGIADYFVYDCMFGCDRDAYAFASGSPPCPSGVLLLSAGNEYLKIALPGTINRIKPAPRPIVVLTRRRNIGDGCNLAFGCQYIYEVREGRFQLVGECSAESCDLLSNKP